MRDTEVVPFLCRESNAGCSSAGVQKSSAGVELGICSTYPICTPNELVAYAERIRSTPDELNI